MTSVLLADDHPFLRAGVEAILRGTQYELVAMVSSGSEALEAIAEHDPAITPQAPALAERLRASGKQFTTFIYLATEHGFFNPARPSYRKDAAELSYQRTLHFLDEQLRSTQRVGRARLASV